MATPTHKNVNGVNVSLTQKEIDDIEAEWSANTVKKTEEDNKKREMLDQVNSEKASLPTWAQVVSAINNAFPNNAQANIIKKIARPVYTYLKKTVD